MKNHLRNLQPLIILSVKHNNFKKNIKRLKVSQEIISRINKINRLKAWYYKENWILKIEVNLSIPLKIVIIFKNTIIFQVDKSLKLQKWVIIKH